MYRSMKRETTVEISSEGFIRTGIKSDICQVTSCSSDVTHCESTFVQNMSHCVPLVEDLWCCFDPTIRPSVLLIVDLSSRY
jgi:hypothetical protein